MTRFSVAIVASLALAFFVREASIPARADALDDREKQCSPHQTGPSSFEPEFSGCVADHAAWRDRVRQRQIDGAKATQDAVNKVIKSLGVTPQ